MPDIRDILKGLDKTHRAVYTEVRTTMRRAYLYAHSKTLPIEDYNEQDDNFLDLLDIKIAQLFDRAGTFNHVEGNLASPVEAEKALHESAATQMMKQQTWPTANGKSN